MKQKEKEYLIAFKLYIEHYDPRYRYPKWIKAISKKDAVTQYMKIIKPDPTLGACIIMEERPVKQNETQETGNIYEVDHLAMFFDVYRKGNLRLLQTIISQLDNLIDPTTPNHGPRPFIIDMDEINEKLCSTSRLVYMLSAGYGPEMLPYNGYIYTDDFFEHVNDYINTRYKNDFYNDYTLMQIRGDLQCMYNEYNRHGILPWETKKLEDHICGTSEVMNVSDFSAVANKDEANEEKTLVVKIIKQRTNQTGLREYTGDLSHYSSLSEEEVNMKENIVKGDRTEEKKSPIDIIEYAPKFDISCADLILNFPYILVIENVNTGEIEKHVVVITQILDNCIYCNHWDNLNDDPHSGLVLTASEFHERKGVLYKITGEELK